MASDNNSNSSDFMRNLQQKAATWFAGRNGADELSGAVTNLAVVLVIINLFVRNMWLSIIALILLAYAWFRISSKNIAKRNAENTAALKAAGPVISFLSNPLAMLQENKDYVHYKCPSCGQKVRVPRGKGKVRITCPKCHTRFDGKA